MNVEIGTEAPIFLFWEYLFQIFGILSLQCGLWTVHYCCIIFENILSTFTSITLSIRELLWYTQSVWKYMRQTHVKILQMNVNSLRSAYFVILFQIYIWPDESLRRNQFRNDQTLDIRILRQPKPWATTETLCYNRNLVLQPKPWATTKSLCYNRNLVLQPTPCATTEKPCATTETLCYNRNLLLQKNIVLQPKPCATTKTLCYNRNLVLQPKPCATTRNLVLQPKPCATTETLCYSRNLMLNLKWKVGNDGFKMRCIKLLMKQIV